VNDPVPKALKMPLPILPFWFKQRQCKAEPHGGEQMLKVSGPNLPEAYVHVRSDDGRWTGGLRTQPEGPDIATAAADEPTEQAAWNAAFELYRQHLIV
jgi:hypothetical protein